jgi:hypothetical protein
VTPPTPGRSAIRFAASGSGQVLSSRPPGRHGETAGKRTYAGLTAGFRDSGPAGQRGNEKAALGGHTMGRLISSGYLFPQRQGSDPAFLPLQHFGQRVKVRHILIKCFRTAARPFFHPAHGLRGPLRQSGPRSASSNSPPTGDGVRTPLPDDPSSLLGFGKLRFGVTPCRPAHLGRWSASLAEAEEARLRADIRLEGRLAPGKRPHALVGSNGRV